MARVSKTYAPSDVFDGSSLGRPLRDEQLYANGRDWSVSRDSLINGRPASIVPLARRYDKKKKRRCCKATKMELFLIFVSVMLLLTAIGIIVAWSIVSKGFRFTDIDVDQPNAKENMCVSASSSNSANSLICTSAACAQLAVNFLENLNPTADPCEDFYEYSCGGFAKHHDIPNDKPYHNVISGVDQNTYKRLKNLLQAPIVESDESPIRQAKSLYQSCENDIDDKNVGAKPMMNILDALGGWPVLDINWTYPGNYSWEMATVDILKGHGKHVLLELSVMLDPINTTLQLIQFDQGDLGLSNRIYYLNGTENYLLKAYYTLMVESAVLLGANRTVAERDMLDVVYLEIELAKVAISEDMRRDPNRLYNPFTKLKLKKRFPKIDFDTLLNNVYSNVVITDDEPILVIELGYLDSLADIMATVNPRIVQNYLLWRLVQDYSNLLPVKFREPLYVFRSVHFGTSARTARWEECVALTRAVLPFVVGSLYVREHFKEESKNAVKQVCHTLKSAFIEEFKHLDWMDPATKENAQAKAINLEYHIGYPDWIYNNTKLSEPLKGINITNENVLESVAKIRGIKYQLNVDRLRQLADQEYWYESPALVDAYYVPQRNEMVFPAGIIQFPFFLNGGPTYVTFATVGSVVGHEIVHGFDDEGRHYDRNGDLHNWWDTKTEKKFQERTDCLVKQYGSIVVPEINKSLNGRLTLGENIADNVALLTAFNAFELWSKKNGEEPKLPGLSNFTNQQLFFIAYANNWCSITRPEYYEYLIYNDVHSPSKYRTLVPLKNFPPFAEAFKCGKNSAMNQPDRCKIW